MIESIDQTKCTGCGICVETCPIDTLRMDAGTGKAFIAYPEECMTCFVCEMNCPAGAVSVHPFKEEVPLAITYEAR